MDKQHQPQRRDFLKKSAVAAGAAAPLLITSRKSWAEAVELNMLAWYGHGEPDMVEEFEALHNVKFKPKYYAGGDNMLALIAQSPPGTYDVILSDAEFVQQLNAAGYIIELNTADYKTSFLKLSRPGHWADDALYSVMVVGTWVFHITQRL